MMEIHTECIPPDVEEDGDDPPYVNVSVDIHEADGRMHGASTMLDEPLATPDEVAEVLLRCIQAVATVRGSDTLIALQQRLAAWGQ